MHRTAGGLYLCISAYISVCTTLVVDCAEITARDTSTADTVEGDGDESTEPSHEPLYENAPEMFLPSSRRMSFRRSRRTRRQKVPASTSDTNVEIVIKGCEGDTDVVEQGNVASNEDKAEEEEENEVLPLQDRLIKQRCVVSIGGVECMC